MIKDNQNFSFTKAISPLKGKKIRLLGDKSLAHRVMILSSLAKGKSIISNFPSSGVTKTMEKCLKQLGINIEINNGVLTVEGNDFKRFINENTLIDCGNSATTMRLIIGSLFGTKTKAIITGSQSLLKRPIRVDEYLSLFNINNYKCKKGYLPIEITNFSDNDLLETIEIETKYNSAQLKTALILIALGLKKKLILKENIKTRDHTERILQSLGINIESENNKGNNIIKLSNKQNGLNPISGVMPGDISSASFILAAAALVPNSEIEIIDVLLNETRTGFLNVLHIMGCTIETEITRTWHGEPVGKIKLKSPCYLKQINIDNNQLIVNMIDEFPVVAALMAYAHGISTVRNAKELRYKESDRIKSIVNAYKQLGLSVHEYEDGFSVNGNSILKSNTPIKTFNDHRIAMSFVLLSLVGDVSIDNDNIINESFPNFKTIINSIRK